MPGNMVASKTGRKRVVARRRTSVLMPCDCWLGSMMSRLMIMPCNRRPGSMAGGLMPRNRRLGNMTSGLMPRGRRLGDLASRSGWPGRGRLVDLAGGSGRSGCSWPGCLSRGLGGPCLMGRPRRAGVAAMSTVVAAPGRCERRCAECRAGESDECEFHEVVVHSAPSLSVFDLFQASPSRPYTRQGNQRGSF